MRAGAQAWRRVRSLSHSSLSCAVLDKRLSLSAFLSSAVRRVWGGTASEVAVRHRASARREVASQSRRSPLLLFAPGCQFHPGAQGSRRRAGYSQVHSRPMERSEWRSPGSGWPCCRQETREGQARPSEWLECGTQACRLRYCRVRGPHLLRAGAGSTALRQQQRRRNSRRPACCLSMNSSGSPYFPTLLLSRELGNPSPEGAGHPGHSEPLTNLDGAFPVSLHRSGQHSDVSAPLGCVWSVFSCSGHSVSFRCTALWCDDRALCSNPDTSGPTRPPTARSPRSSGVCIPHAALCVPTHPSVLW